MKNCTDFSVNIFVYRLKNIKIKISLIQRTIDPDLDSAVLLFTFDNLRNMIDTKLLQGSTLVRTKTNFIDYK